MWQPSWTRPVLNLAQAGHGLVYLHLIFGRDLNQNFDITIPPNVSSVCSTFRPQLCTLDSRWCTVECKHAQLNSAANPSTARICPGMAKCKCSIPARHRNICQWLRPLNYCTLFDVLVLLDPDMTFADDTVFNTSSLSVCVPTGSPSCGGDVMVYVININQLSLPTPFYSVLVSVSVL